MEARSKLAAMNTPQGSELFSAIVPAPFGAIGIRTEGERVRELVYLEPRFGDKAPEDAAAALAARQVEQYLADPGFVFDLPLMEAGSDFQRRVWGAISAIPRGSVRTYGELARHIGSAPRAVGQACGANWFPIVVPCHRVTSAAGLGGFANSDDPNGYLLGIKRWLLAHEGSSEYAWQQTTLL